MGKREQAMSAARDTPSSPRRKGAPCSMTGFGRGQALAGDWQATIELQTLNRRQLDIQFSLGAGLACLETRAHQAIAAVIRRGRVQGSLSVRRRSGPLEQVVINEALADALWLQVRQWGKRVGACVPLDPIGILHLPGVIRSETAHLDPDVLWPLIEKALARALRQVEQSRRAEGRRLVADLDARLHTLSEWVATISEAAPAATTRYRHGLQERLRAMAAPALADERLLREVALYADRVDISEELERLCGHLQQARRLLRQDPEPGRTLDFYAQELLREINTLGAKACDGNIALAVVTFKTELERWREQLQNLQ